jgi:very-short-patch-repair endonuclease/predicted transcriptional regulator of viral defense system
VIWAALEALVYMEVDEEGFRGNPEWRLVVWRVMRAGGRAGGKPGMPARVSHDVPPQVSGVEGLAAVAEVQHGLVTRWQLVALGFSAKAIEHRVRIGSLHRVLRGVFAVGHRALLDRSDRAAALLYAGENTVLSHDSAAALWGLTSNPSFVAITMIGRHARGQPNLRIHQVKQLDIRDVRLHQGFPVTSVARTLIDCAAGSLPLDRLLNEARALSLVKDAEIYAAMDRCPGRNGTAALRALMETEMNDGFTRSKAERVLRRIVRESGIDRPIFNAKVVGVEADAYWPAHRLVVEVDGYPTHGRWVKFQSDRVRDNRLVAAGYTVLRFTWHQLKYRAMYVLAEVVRTIARTEAQAA